MSQTVKLLSPSPLEIHVEIGFYWQEKYGVDFQDFSFNRGIV